MMLGRCVLLACWIGAFARATDTDVTTLCTTLSPFVRKVNAALLSAIGATAVCTADSPWGATVSFEGNVAIVGYEFGKFGLHFTMEPCKSPPSFDFGATVSGSTHKLTSLVYGESKQVRIPGLSVGVASLALSVTLSGTISNTTLRLGLSAVLFGSAVKTIPLLGSAGIKFSLSKYECPVCPAYSSGTTSSTDCNTDSCPDVTTCMGSWGSWGSCSKTCGIGTQSRTYSITTAAANGGSSCAYSSGTILSTSCSTDSCPVVTNCVGSWGSWGSCSKTCGTGAKSRTYSITTAALNGGSSCAYSSGATLSTSCNTDTCTSCTNCATDCVGAWSSWSSCSATCGGGTKYQAFLITIPASGGGSSCPFTGGDTVSESCFEDACPQLEGSALGVGHSPLQVGVILFAAVCYLACALA